MGISTLVLLACVSTSTATFEVTLQDGIVAVNNEVYSTHTAINDRTIFASKVQKAGSILKSKKAIMIDRFSGEFNSSQDYVNTANPTEDFFVVDSGVCTEVERKF